ncbi:hypothetical protein Tco_1409760 [Tanacetum coccineum]
MDYSLGTSCRSQPSFDEFMATSIDFFAFMMNRLKSCKSVAELEYHLEEVFKAINDQLDWNNPEGTPYPHDLSKPLPLIPNARGRLVIPFDHFINNDLEYLKGGSLRSLEVYGVLYMLSTTNTPTREHITGVQNVRDSIDMLPTWKLQRMYTQSTGSSQSLVSNGYSHLEKITVRRQDDKLYKFREGDFKRLRRQDIEDILLLLVQGKLTNLSLDERYALNVALRMYTHHTVIQERVEDL